MPLEVGTRLGPYEVVAPVGAVSDERYTASDTRSGRVVTITVLPGDLARSGEGRARLEREVGKISSLSHPHISALVEMGHEAPSTDFLVTEHVEGETLAARLARGPMELSEALQTAIAIADSLDAAHRQGVIHGGLTPSTVVLTAQGPRLLDFGMAGLSAPSTEAKEGTSAGSASMAATRTSAPSLSAVPDAAAPYRAPEQYAGAPAGVAADIFALGAILYEMVTGRRAFEEKTLALLVAAVQTVDPEPVSKTQPMAPAALDHVVARCLSKDPRQRTQTAWDLLTQLRWIADGGSQVGIPAPVTARRTSHERLVWAALGVTAVLAAVLAPSAASFFRDVPEPEAVSFSVTGLTAQVSIPLYVSPDGRWVTGVEAGAQPGYAAISLSSLTPQMILEGHVPGAAFWSPDSRSMAFFEEGVLKRAEIAGGPAQAVTEAPPPYGLGSWSGDVMLYSSGGVIYRVSAQGGEPTPVADVDENGDPFTGEEHLGPFFLPDGRHYLYLAASNDSAIYLGSLDSRARTRLIASESLPYYAPPTGSDSAGHILFNRENTLFAQPFDEDALTLAGEPIRVMDNLAMRQGQNYSPRLTQTANYAVSQTGVLVFKEAAGGGGGATAAPAAAPGVQRSLVWLGRDGLEAEQVGTGAFAGIGLAPDGARFAVHLHEDAGGDVWTFDPAQGRLGRFTFDASQENSSPAWSPDGSRIAFASQRDGRWGIYVRPADGTGQEELIVETAQQSTPWSWSPDGALLVYQQAGVNADVWAVPVDSERKPVAILQSSATEAAPEVSPDGKWVAYMSDETGRFEIYVAQFPEGPAKVQVSDSGGQFPRWRGDGKELFYGRDVDMMAVAIDTTGLVPRPGVPEGLFGLPGNPNLAGHFQGYARYAVSADGQRFLISRPGAGARGQGGGIDQTIRANADQNLGGAFGRTRVVINWQRMLAER